MIEERKVICDGCGRDITHDIDSYYIRRKRPYKVFRVWWGIQRSLFTDRIRRPISQDVGAHHADLCMECFQNVCRYMEVRNDVQSEIHSAD